MDIRERIIAAERLYWEHNPQATFGQMLVDVLIAPEEREEPWAKDFAQMDDVDVHMAFKEALDYPVGMF